jgi:hypothetical protein
MASPRTPRLARPPSTRAYESPVPTITNTKLSRPRAMPCAASPRAAQRTSDSTVTGPSRASISTGCTVQAMTSRLVRRPAGSTYSGKPAPMPSTLSPIASASATSASASASVTLSPGSRAPSTSDERSRTPRSRPSTSTRPPATLVPPTSRPSTTARLMDSHHRDRGRTACIDARTRLRSAGCGRPGAPVDRSLRVRR